MNNARRIIFKTLEDAVNYALDKYYKKPFEFVVDGKVYSTNEVSRAWACWLCPYLYYELYDETYQEGE